MPFQGIERPAMQSQLATAPRSMTTVGVRKMKHTHHPEPNGTDWLASDGDRGGGRSHLGRVLHGLARAM